MLKTQIYNGLSNMHSIHKVVLACFFLKEEKKYMENLRKKIMAPFFL